MTLKGNGDEDESPKWIILDSYWCQFDRIDELCGRTHTIREIIQELYNKAKEMYNFPLFGCFKPISFKWVRINAFRHFIGHALLQLSQRNVNDRSLHSLFIAITAPQCTPSSLTVWFVKYTTTLSNGNHPLRNFNFWLAAVMRIYKYFKKTRAIKINPHDDSEGKFMTLSNYV